jgi:hypothetical protein
MITIAKSSDEQAEVYTLCDRDLWSGSLGSYEMDKKVPYVILETRVFKKWSRKNEIAPSETALFLIEAF